MSAVSSIADAINSALGLAKPVIDDIEAQKYEKQFQDRISQFQSIMETVDSDSRAQSLGSLVAGVCAAAGYPVAGGVQGNISITIQDFAALYTAACGYAKDQAYSAKFIQKLTS